MPGTKHLNPLLTMDKNKNVPKLRFPEFTGEWEEKKLGEIIISLDSGVSVNSVNESIKLDTEYGILKTSCIASGMFYPEENKKIIDDEISRARLNPSADTILISRMNTPLLVGESGYVAINYSNLFVPDRLWMAKTNSKTANAKLLSIILSSKNMMGKITNIATGTSGSMKNISKPNFLNLEISMPDTPEQTKIASFLTAVDEKLTQQKKKKTLLEQYKKGIMQKLFSQELRFKDNNNQDFPDWQEKTLGEIMECLDSKRKPVNSTERESIKGNIPYYGANGIQGYVNNYIFDGEFVLLAEDGGNFDDYRKRPIAQYISGKVWVNNHAHILKANGNTLFLFYSLVHKDIRAFINGTSRSKLNQTDMVNIVILYPSLPEQQKIATFLSSIDEKINHSSAQIEKMEAWKKGLLQQMFC